jgi:hypothetical protein
MNLLGYNKFMRRQPKVFTLAFFLASVALANTSTDSVYIVPSESTTEKRTESTATTATPQAMGLDVTKGPQKQSTVAMAHLPPGQSLTLVLSRAHENSEPATNYWFGIHYVPWMDATNRVQAGVDITDKTGWFNVAYHNLLSRNLSRFYWGGGLSLIVDADDHFAPLVKLDNYNLFIAGGWELQMLAMQSLRIEASYHHGTEFRFLKGSLGYTFHF